MRCRSAVTLWSDCNSRPTVPFLALTVIACSAASPAVCPAHVTDSGGDHPLYNASLYDGPPEQMVDLPPVSGVNVDKWDLGGVDPYLVCKFKGTIKVVTMHATGAKTCEAGKKPFQAYCKP